MTTNSITTKATIVALTVTLKSALLLIDLSGSLDGFIHMTPPRNRLLYAVGNWGAGVAMSLTERLRSAGEALEEWEARTSNRLGVEDHMIRRVYGFC
jgi:hypothetical protein